MLSQFRVHVNRYFLSSLNTSVHNVKISHCSKMSLLSFNWHLETVGIFHWTYSAPEVSSQTSIDRNMWTKMKNWHISISDFYKIRKCLFPPQSLMLCRFASLKIQVQLYHNYNNHSRFGFIIWFTLQLNV